MEAKLLLAYAAPTHWVTGVFLGKSSDWSADVQRAFHAVLVSCCSQCVGLHVQKTLKVLYALSIPAW